MTTWIKETMQVVAFLLLTTITGILFNITTEAAGQEAVRKKIEQTAKTEKVNQTSFVSPQVPEVSKKTMQPNWQAINDFLLQRIDPSYDFQLPPEIDNEQFRCLALNVYYEARGSTVDDQIAVAHVTLNRVKHSLWGNTICDVVWEKNQFSWTRNIYKVREAKAWINSQVVAYDVLTGAVVNPIADATHYFNPSVVYPRWAHTAVSSMKVGSHLYMLLSESANYSVDTATRNTIRYASAVYKYMASSS